MPFWVSAYVLPFYLLDKYVMKTAFISSLPLLFAMTARKMVYRTLRSLWYVVFRCRLCGLRDLRVVTAITSVVWSYSLLVDASVFLLYYWCLPVSVYYIRSVLCCGAWNVAAAHLHYCIFLVRTTLHLHVPRVSYSAFCVMPVRRVVVHSFY